jgi:RNA polymerase sigma-70 factor (ECF subfamily)
MRTQRSDPAARFEQAMLPHMNAAYNLARWLMRNESDAEDAVQEAYLRAFRFFESFQGEDGRGWLLAIVRNTCRTALVKSGTPAKNAEFQEEIHSFPGVDDVTTETQLARQDDIDSVRWCIERLPAEYREVIVLRELEQMSYKEIAGAIAAPLGTIMSRLARARARLQDCLTVRIQGVRA